jgi:hypothetical protein
MSVSGINSADSLYTTYLSILNQANSGGTNSGAVVSGNQPTWGGENTFMQGITSALSQIGISMPSASNGISPNSNTDLATDSSSSPVNSVHSGGGHGHGHVLGKFMRDLIATVEEEESSSGAGSSSTSSSKAASSSGSSSATAASSGSQSPYSTFSSKLEQLISQLGTGSEGSSSVASATGGSISTLQTDFNNLVSALGTASPGSSSNGTSGTSSGAAGTATSNDLQAFLQDLLANMGSTTTVAASGNFINQYC